MAFVSLRGRNGCTWRTMDTGRVLQCGQGWREVRYLRGRTLCFLESGGTQTYTELTSITEADHAKDMEQTVTDAPLVLC